MAEHRWRWTGEPREFPYHDLRDGDGERVVVVGTGDVVVTGSVVFGDDHPDLAVRLDKPRSERKPRKRAAKKVAARMFEKASDGQASEPEAPANAGSETGE